MTARPAVGALTVEPLRGGRYQVTGGAGPHIVTIGADSASCDCGDCTYRRRGCKHLRALLDYLVLAPLEHAFAAGPGLSDVDVPPPEALQ